MNPALAPCRSFFLDLRGLRYHLRSWGNSALDHSGPPPLVLLHGWMDSAASFQFVVDALQALEGSQRQIIAPDWRGFGLTEAPIEVDTYWFPDYLADLDALLRQLWPDGRAIDLLGHSLGGNVAMAYAGIRPQRVRRLVNLEGFGLPGEPASRAPERLGRWLDALAEPSRLKDYEGLDAVAARLQKTNPRLNAERARWLASQWAEQDAASGRWRLLADPAHKRPFPQAYPVAEMQACWERIEAPVLWVEGEQTELFAAWGHHYTRSEFEQRLGAVRTLERVRLSPAGHMLHHDQPEALAAHLKRFLDAGQGV